MTLLLSLTCVSLSQQVSLAGYYGAFLSSQPPSGRLCNFFLAVLRGTDISKVKAHSASVLIIVCSSIVFLFFDLKGEIKEREGVKREEID